MCRLRGGDHFGESHGGSSPSGRSGGNRVLASDGQRDPWRGARQRGQIGVVEPERARDGHSGRVRRELRERDLGDLAAPVAFATPAAPIGTRRA